MERAATTASSLEAKQDSDTIFGGVEAQIRFKAASKQSNDPPLSRVNTLGSGEDNMKLKELMELFNAARHKLPTVGLVNTIRLNLMLSVQVNAVEGDFINTSIKVNRERQIQALVDKKRVIITETSIRSDLKLKDAEGTDCLPTATIFAELERIGLQEKVLDLEEAKTAQAKEIASLKKRFKQLEKRKKSRTLGLKWLRKGRKIANLDDDEEVTLIDETQDRNDEEMSFDVQDDLQGEEVVAEKEVAEKEVSAATTASAPTITINELTLAQTLIEIKEAKPKAITTAATTTTTTRPRLEGL
ncbi:hypothetical protein Tco_1509364 [Tanacetum coccineum]